MDEMASILTLPTFLCHLDTGHIGEGETTIPAFKIQAAISSSALWGSMESSQ